MAFADPALRVRRARIVGDRLAADARERLERRLESLTPAGRDDLVLVRRIAARLPARALERHREDPDPAWSAPAARLRQLIAGARSPWHEATDPGVEAVRFADVAEWLACAATDLLQGRIASRWWWACRDGDGAALVAAMWQAHPAELPFALALLAQRRLAAAACLALPAAAPIRDAVERCHGLPHRAAADLIAVLEAHPEIRRLLPELDAKVLESAPEAAALAACGLAVTRTPAAWRGLCALPVSGSPGVAAERPAARRTDAPPLPPATEVSTTPAEPRRATRRGDSSSQARAPTHTAPSADVGTPGRSNTRLPATLAGEAAGATAAVGRDTADQAATAASPAATTSPDINRPLPRRPAAASGLAEAASDDLGATRPTARPDAAAAIPTAAPASDPLPCAPGAAVPDVAAPYAASRIDTACGGLFHLLNMALALDLYGDFSRPRDPGIALHPWDFLALAGHRLLGRRFASDPLAGLLARLAGRPPGVPPGAWAAAPDPDWAIPGTWLAAWPHADAAAWQQSAADGRTALWHPAGFCVVDATTESAPVAGWLARLAADGRTLRPGRGRPRRIRHWQDWMARLAPFLRARLARATAWPARQAMTRLLWRPARIDRAAGRLDIVMSLAELPLPIRLAGLDRDPGWLPAAGCDLRYRFD